MSLYFAEELATGKRDFGEQFNQQLKHLITEFAYSTEELQKLPPQRGHLDHKVKLTGYTPRQRRNRLPVSKYEELTRQCTELLKKANYESRAVLTLLQLIWLESQKVLLEFA